jgi:branched-chain amino acid transport system substrate-binding protein
VRHPRRAAAVVVALAACLAGCGGSGAAPGGFTYQGKLTVYSDLPLQGSDPALQMSIVNGEKLALYEAGGHAGRIEVAFESLNDADRSTGQWTAEETSDSARQAVQDLKAIAYIGDFDSGATATSLPLTNQNDILQVSPASPYVGFTNANPADIKGEPDSYYGVPQQTFARLMPTDLQEAAASTELMHSLGVKRLYVLSDLAGTAVYDGAIASMVAARAPHSEVKLSGEQQIDTDTNAKPVGYAQIVARIAATHPDAVFVGDAPGPGAQALWQELHRLMPSVKLFAPSTLATAPFLAGLGAAGAATYVTSPILELNQYPPRSQAVLRAYRAHFNSAPTAYTLYGFEAMQSVLAAIDAAGKNGSVRRDVIKAYFALGERDSVIGRYSISRRGDTSLSRFAGYRVGPGGKLVELRLLSGG